MVDRNAEAGYSQVSDAEAKTTVFAGDEPPKEEWAIYEVIKNGELVESYKVPFTREEINIVKFLLEKTNDPDLLNGYADGGPERQHRLALRVPHEHGLDNRRYAIGMLRETARVADDIVKRGIFNPHLRSREPILAIRDALGMLLPP